MSRYVSRLPALSPETHILLLRQRKKETTVENFHFQAVSFRKHENAERTQSQRHRVVSVSSAASAAAERGL